MTVSDRWTGGDAYEAYVGRWSRKIAPRFLDWLAVPAHVDWIDVGCGTGALTEAILASTDPLSVTSVEPSASFLNTAKERVRDPRARFLAGSAAELPVEDGSADLIGCALVLNFIPDLERGLAEMVRVARSGGVIAGYVWDYADGMEVIRRFWDAAVSLDPAAASMDEGIRFPLCRPAALSRSLLAAGLTNVDTRALEVEARFASFDDYWRPFLGGVAPAPAYLSSLPPDHRAALCDELRSRVEPGKGRPVVLRARAWAVRGTAP